LISENKDYWYDGLFYDYFIAPNQDKAFRLSKNLIKKDSSVIDVGCGTGRLAFQLKDICSRVDGVDLSLRNINVANKKLTQTKSVNIQFHHSDVGEFLKNNSNKFDYAVMSYVIHEMDENIRLNILNTLAAYVNKIILVDYLAPKPVGFRKHLNEAVEFLAGSDHYKNYKTYIKNGGINFLAAHGGFKIIKEIKNTPISSHIAVLQKED